MSYFRYKLLAPTGEVSAGIANLPYKDVFSAISHFERDGNMTIYVRKLGQVTRFFVKLGAILKHKKFPRSAQAELLNNMSLMLRSGVPLVTALEETAGSSESPNIEKDIKVIITKIQGGASLSEAADLYRHIFPRVIVYLMRIGEETGKLDKLLKDGAAHLTRMQKIISDTKQALLYPGIVFSTMGAGLIFWFVYVVPKIVALFKEMNVALPAITIFLISASEFVQTYLLGILAGTALIIFSLVVLRKNSRRFRKMIDVLLLKMPLSSSIISASVLAFITEYFSLLISAGIDIRRSVALVRDAVRNEVYRDKLAEVGTNLEKGEGISDGFKKTVIFPPFVVRMINIGEISGTLPEQLTYIADEYRTKLSILVATVGKMIEPIVLIIAGVFFAVILGGLFLPIYDLVSKVGGV